ncbi:MAG TPA: hemerythrin domain-containing protein, partial [Fimbriimonas sp.]
QEHRAEVAANYLEAWRIELKDHFDEEERLLGPLAPDEDRRRLLEEHAQITEMTGTVEAGDITPAHLAALGQALNDHIRWEERSFFVAIENHATEEQLAKLAEGTHELEKRRWTHSPKREELVQRRLNQKP